MPWFDYTVKGQVHAVDPDKGIDFLAGVLSMGSVSRLRVCRIEVGDAVELNK